MGWDMRRLNTVAHDLAGTNGAYVFARTETANAFGHRAQLATPLPVSYWGFPDSASATATPVADSNIRYQYYGFYFQDNWRISTELTLNLGMRYDIPINWYQSIMATVSLTAPNPAVNNYPGALSLRAAARSHWPDTFLAH